MVNRWRKGFAEHPSLYMGLLVLALWTAPASGLAATIPWEPLVAGVAVSVWTPDASCPSVPTMLAVDVDPELARFSIHYYADEKLSYPVTIEEWKRLTGHDILFNAGLFRENFAYLGLLYKGGRALGSRRHGTWQGLFVAEPVVSGVRKARVLDLSWENFDEIKPLYQEAAQALMLLDHSRKIRVRQTGKEAYQTIVVETDQGHIVILKSRHLASLYDIARCLRETAPWVRQAMAMDGGSSSDMLVSESLWREDRRTEDDVSWKALFGGSKMVHVPLPTVIGISRR